MSNQEPVTVAIKQFLAQISSTKSPSRNNITFMVALSGGADSVALLHALSEQVSVDVIQAIYIDHQLQPASEQWAEANGEFCRKLGVSFQSIKVEVDTSAASLENEARIKRYQALSDIVGTEQYLLTGHHQDDQAETLLLQLFRGAGPKGLSAMPKLTAFSQGQHARPLLNIPKQAILDYCKEHSLAFIEDPSNQDTKHRRNFVRHKVLPLLESEWAQLKATLSRASQLQSDTQELLTELARQDYARCFVQGEGIPLGALSELTLARQRNLVRYWLETLGHGMPSEKVLDEILSQQVMSSQDAQPSIVFGGGMIRRHDGFLKFTNDDSKLVFKEHGWDGSRDLQLTKDLTISSEWLKQHYPELVGEPLTVSLRQGGERLQKPNREHSSSLKNYFQENKIPVWQRDKVVLIKLSGVVRAIYTEHLSRY